MPWKSAGARMDAAVQWKTGNRSQTGTKSGKAHSAGRGCVLVTGATGSLGGALIERILADSDMDVLALVRESGRESAEMRLHAAIDFEQIPGEARGRIGSIPGDIRRAPWHGDTSLRNMLRTRVTEIFHLAASTDLTGTRESLMAANVDGTQAMLTLAQDLHSNGRLERFNHFSTAFIAGSAQDHHAMEAYPCPQPAWANAYEESKHIAEGNVHAAIAGGLPATVFRPSIVVGNSDDGYTRSFGLFYHIVRKIKRSGIRRLPGEESDRIQIVPLDFVCNAALEISRRTDSTGGIFHLVSDNAPDFATLLRVGAEEMEWARGLSLIPVERFSPAARSVLQSAFVFLNYFHRDLDFDTTNTREALRGSGIAMPDTDAEYIRRILHYACAMDYL